MSANASTAVQAVVFDWAGTTIDHGSRAPAAVFQEIFRQRGVAITAQQAREPMGMAKREHIAAVASMESVAKAWVEEHGSPCDEAAIDAMYADFLPLQKATLTEHCELIPGVVEVTQLLRDKEIKIGSSTGYTHELMEVVSREAERQGYKPDLVLCAEDAPRGRPAPYLLFRAAIELEVFPMHCVVKVDDTRVGIEAGRNAGCWTVAVTRTGNGVGLSREEFDGLDPNEQKKRCAAAAEQLGPADFVVESVAEMPQVIAEVELRLAKGERPRC